MANETDMVLRDLITSVRQVSRFDQMGRKTQVVEVAFTTPHDFTGTVEMPLATWKNPEKRAEIVLGAVMDLEGPFMDSGEPGEEPGG